MACGVVPGWKDEAADAHSDLGATQIARISTLPILLIFRHFRFSALRFAMEMNTDSPYLGARLVRKPNVYNDAHQLPGSHIRNRV